MQDNCSILAAYGKSNVHCEWQQRVYDYFSNRFPDRFTSVKTMTEYARNLLLNDPKGKAKRFLEHLLVLGGFEKCHLSVRTIDNAPRIVFTYRKFGLIVDIPENDEAKGKLRFLGMSSWLYRQIESPTFVMLDGIDKELHPDIRAFFYHAFLHNCQKESQLLFTTHSFYLLDLGFIRRDILWETKMGNHFDTILTPMKDFRIPKGNSLTNAYKQGKVGEHPKIGDFRLNLKKLGFKVKEEKKEASEIQEKIDA